MAPVQSTRAFLRGGGDRLRVHLALLHRYLLAVRSTKRPGEKELPMTSRTTNHVSSPWWGAPWSRLRKHRERVMSTWIWTRTRAEAPASRGPPFALANRVSS